MIYLNELLFVHKYCKFSKVNGYGLRAVVWVQGCSIKCKECFNKETHSFSNGGSYVDPKHLAKKLSSKKIDGLTITGGEPLDQSDAVISLIDSFKNFNNGTIILFTGYELNTILNSESKKEVLLMCDAVIAGPYIKKSSTESNMWNNKEIIILNKKLSLNDIIPKYDIEIIVDDSDVLITGYPNNDNLKELKRLLLNLNGVK